MHMADALISPAVGGTMWAVTAATTVYCARRVREEGDPARIPLMGVTGAFVFAAQMVNFTIPGTGSSGHIGGGLILAILLGPEAAFLVIASVLTIQALFFADGGLLALGCNIINLGFFPAFVAYPLVFRRIVGADFRRSRVFVGAIIGALAGLLLGALAVVVETTVSGVSDAPFIPFAVVMLTIHTAIGLVEGFVTAVVVTFVHTAQPEVLASAARRGPLAGGVARTVVVGLAVAAVVAGGALSWFASADPDGLEWSVARVIGTGADSGRDDAVSRAAEKLQERTAILPDYALKGGESEQRSSAPTSEWPAVDGGTSVAGVLGSALTLVVVAGIGLILRRRSRRRGNPLSPER